MLVVSYLSTAVRSLFTTWYMTSTPLHGVHTKRDKHSTPRSTHQTGQALHSMEYAQNLKLDSTCSHEIKCLHNMPLHLQWVIRAFHKGFYHTESSPSPSLLKKTYPEVLSVFNSLGRLQFKCLPWMRTARSNDGHTSYFMEAPCFFTPHHWSSSAYC